MRISDWSSDVCSSDLPVGCRSLARVGDAGADKISEVARAAAAPERLPVDEPAAIAARREQAIVDPKVAVEARPRRRPARPIRQEESRLGRGCGGKGRTGCGPAT